MKHTVHTILILKITKENNSVQNMASVKALNLCTLAVYVLYLCQVFENNKIFLDTDFAWRDTNEYQTNSNAKSYYRLIYLVSL